MSIHDMSGRYISRLSLSPTLEAKYFRWRQARYDGLAVGRKRDKEWWNDLDSQKKLQELFNDEKNENVI
jgi:hypothetical protein